MAESNMSSASCGCCDNLERLGIPATSSGVDNQNNLEAGFIPKLAVNIPGIIKINEKCSVYPIVNHRELNVMFKEMVDILGGHFSDYEENILSFWALDMFIEGLKAAQESDMNHDHQKITLLWIAFMFNYISKTSNSRKEVFKYFFSLILPLSHFDNVTGEHDEDEERSIIDINRTNALGQPIHDIANSWIMPLPPDFENNEPYITVDIESSEDSLVSADDENPEDSKSSMDKVLMEMNISHMKIILEIIYRMQVLRCCLKTISSNGNISFSRFWVFKALRVAFQETPTASIVDLPFILNAPKTIFQKKVVTPLQSGKLPKKQQEEEDIDVALYKTDFILPLQFADGAKIYAQHLFNISSKEVVPVSVKVRKK